MRRSGGKGSWAGLGRGRCGRAGGRGVRRGSGVRRRGWRARGSGGAGGWFVLRRGGGAAGAGERESGQFPQPPVEGVLHAEAGEFGDEPGVAAQPQVEFDAFQQHRQPQLRQALAVDPGVGTGEPREGGSLPQAQRPGQQFGRLAGALRGGARTGLGDESVEDVEVQRSGGEVQEVALAVGRDPGPEGAPEPVDVRPDRARRRAGRLLPQRPSTISSRSTTSLRRRRSIASSARCCGDPRGTCASPLRTRTAPSTEKNGSGSALSTAGSLLVTGCPFRGAREGAEGRNRSGRDLWGDRAHGVISVEGHTDSHGPADRQGEAGPPGLERPCQAGRWYDCPRRGSGACHAPLGGMWWRAPGLGRIERVRGGGGRSARLGSAGGANETPAPRHEILRAVGCRPFRAGPAGGRCPRRGFRVPPRPPGPPR